MTTTAPARLRDTVLLVVATAVAWWAWTAWDLQRDVDPVTGRGTGPWEVWQVAGAILTLLAVVVLAVRRLPLPVVLLMVPLAFTAAWFATAVPLDDSGLSALGAIMVLAGTTMGVGVVAPLAALVARRTVPDG